MLLSSEQIHRSETPPPVGKMSEKQARRISPAGILCLHHNLRPASLALGTASCDARRLSSSPLERSLRWGTEASCQQLALTCQAPVWAALKVDLPPALVKPPNAEPAVNEKNCQTIRALFDEHPVHDTGTCTADNGRRYSWCVKQQKWGVSRKNTCYLTS